MLQTGREHPWNTRRISHRHLHDHRNLVDLHLLTQAWQGVPDPAAPEQAAHAVPNPFESEPELDDDTWPEDVLLRLDHAVRAIQWREIARHVQEGDASKLDERSFQAGSEVASRRWTQSDPNEGSIAPADKRALLMALYHSPLAGLEGSSSFLVRRALITEVSVELLRCPHRRAEAHKASGFKEAAPKEAAIDELCRQQFHWLRGYFSFLNPALTPVHSRPRGRCVVSW